MIEIKLHNRSGDVAGLLEKSMRRLSYSPSHSPYGYGYGVYPPHTSVPVSVGRVDNGEMKIFFYEFSNPHRIPRKFESIEEFDSYLKRCGIELLDFQSTILKVLGTSYVMCKEGKKDLLIMNSWYGLSNYHMNHGCT